MFISNVVAVSDMGELLSNTLSTLEIQKGKIVILPIWECSYITVTLLQRPYPFKKIKTDLNITVTISI